MNINKISDIVQFQIKNIFGLEKKEEIELNIIGGGYFVLAHDQTLMCLNYFSPKYYDGQINPYNSVMYCIFLYWLSHFLYKGGQTQLADKVYYYAMIHQLYIPDKSKMNFQNVLSPIRYQ